MSAMRKRSPMKKLLVTILTILIVMSLMGCDNTKPDANVEKPPETVTIEASQEVQLLAQNEVDLSVNMLTEDGFYTNNDYSGDPITIEVEESKITNLQLAKQIDCQDGSTLDLYEFDFKVLPNALPDKELFVLNSDGWIASDNNFAYSDANSVKLLKGQLYLVVHNLNGELSSLGVKRADSLTDNWCNALLAGYNYTYGIAFDKAGIPSIFDYWKYEEEWSFTMPCYNGNGDTWNVGLGSAHEFGLGIPYKIIEAKDQPAEDIASYAFSTAVYRYFEGFTVVSLQGFYGDEQNAPGFIANQYISTTQPDCNTSRGIHAGDTVDALRTAYPEVYKDENYSSAYYEGTSVVPHDSCWCYTPEMTNRSILFLTKNDIIVQIDMSDGLHGQNTSPSVMGNL